MATLEVSGGGSGDTDSRTVGPADQPASAMGGHLSWPRLHANALTDFYTRSAAVGGVGAREDVEKNSSTRTNSLGTGHQSQTRLIYLHPFDAPALREISVAAALPDCPLNQSITISSISPPPLSESQKSDKLSCLCQRTPLELGVPELPVVILSI